MNFDIILYRHLVETHSWIKHLECTNYIPNADFGVSLYISFKPDGDLLHYVHPPSFVIFRSAEEEGEWLY
jgi:hypothetical protein